MNDRMHALREARIRTLVFTCRFLAFCALFALVLDYQDVVSNPSRIANYSAVIGSCIVTLALVRQFPSIASTVFIVSLQVAVLVGPWFSGGVRRPASFLEIPLLLLSSFLAGPRQTLALGFSFALNTSMMAWFEDRGMISSVTANSSVQVFLLAMSTLFGLYFVARPIQVANDLLGKAKDNRKQNLEHKTSLAQHKEILDRRIAEREKELKHIRDRLVQGTEALSSRFEPALQRITVRAHFIQEALKDRDESIRFPVERILAGCERLARLHQAISRFSRLGPEGIQAVDLEADEIRSTIRQLWDEIRQAYPRAEHRLFLNQLSGCRADPDLFRQVWQNLLSNAAKFSARESKPLIVVGFKNGEFYVNDNGVGFDAQVARNLFEIFGRQHSIDEFPGDGIGLASAKRIIEIHGGTLRVESELGKGATFFFKLGTPTKSG